MCTSYGRLDRPRDQPADADADDDDDDDVTFGEHDEFKLIPGGHAAADRRTTGRRRRETTLAKSIAIANQSPS